MNLLIPYLLASFLLMPSDAEAWQIRFGPGVMTGAPSIADVKYLSIAKEWSLKENVYWKIEGGGWTDNRKTGSNSFMLGPAVGLVLRPWILDVRVSVGIAAISHTDDYLGGHFQFYEDLFGGIRDGGAAIGFTLSHLSSAGIFMPNRGRNFLTLTAMYDF